MSSHRCIWCLESSGGDEHKEHIIPEALGCPEGFYLSSTDICKRCNNGLAHLDQAVIDEFDFLIFMAGVPRKRGRFPVVRSRGNVLATVERDGPTMTFNMDPEARTAHDGSRLAAFRGAKRDVRAKLTKQGQQASISFELPFGQNPKFVRGMIKIGFSALAYFLGADIARRSTFDHVRDFVVKNLGDRHLLLAPSDDSTYRNIVWSPYVSPSGDHAITFRIAAMEFLVDLSCDESLLPTFVSKASASFGTSTAWTILPTAQ